MNNLNEDILIIGTSVLLLIMISVGFIFFMIAYQKKRIKFLKDKLKFEQELKEIEFQKEIQLKEKEIQKLVALHDERYRISFDMHDELGSGLSSIRLISEMLKSKYSDIEVQNDLSQVIEIAVELTGNMRDLVWSLNPSNDKLDKFLFHIQQFSKYFFEPSNIQCQVTLPETIPDIIVSGFIRRNLFLCIKEILNNVIKHSKANSIKIQSSFNESELHFTIEDNGIGINAETVPNSGFCSMERRIKDINGTIEWCNSKSGLKTFIRIHL
jgi:two-component system sensor histidine kinase DesK